MSKKRERKTLSPLGAHATRGTQRLDFGYTVHVKPISTGEYRRLFEVVEELRPGLGEIAEKLGIPPLYVGKCEDGCEDDDAIELVQDESGVYRKPA